MVKSVRHAGNINMRGKKEMTLSCGCCDCRDLRGKEESKRARQELRAAVALGKLQLHGRD